MRNFRLSLLAGFIFLLPRLCQAEPTLELAGKYELVIGTRAMNCDEQPGAEGIDVTDIPVTAIRMSADRVLMLAGNSNNWYIDGPSVDQVARHGCNQMLKSSYDPDPARFRGKEYVEALHHMPNGKIFGFVHNEYHGELYNPVDCPRALPTSPEVRCWYASTTFVVALDPVQAKNLDPVKDAILLASPEVKALRTAGRSTPGSLRLFHPVDDRGVIGASPTRYQDGQLRMGVFEPKVITNPKDGNVYVMASISDRQYGVPVGQCLFRMAAPYQYHWRAWNGRAFGMKSGSPYRSRDAGYCTKVREDLVTSIKYLPKYGLFISLSMREPTPSTRVIEYRFSSDLIHWGESKTLLRLLSFSAQLAAGRRPTLYYSLLDPGSSSINFDTLEARPYLYFVQIHVDAMGRLLNRERDLLRVPLIIRD